MTATSHMTTAAKIKNLAERNEIFDFVCIHNLSNSLKGDNRNDILILYKQSYNVFCLTDKTARRTACGPQGTY